MNKRTFLEIYALAVCFVTLVAFSISVGIGLYDLAQIRWPEFTMDAYQYERHQSNEAFRTDPDAVYWGGFKPAPEDVEIDEEEMTRVREASFQSVVRAERRRAEQSLLEIGIIMVVNVLLFFPHWILAKRQRRSLSDFYKDNDPGIKSV